LFDSQPRFAITFRPNASDSEDDPGCGVSQHHADGGAGEHMAEEGEPRLSHGRLSDTMGLPEPHEGKRQSDDEEQAGRLMAITFHPNPGTVLICDFSTGFQPPEMVKRRHVVVMSPRRRHHSGLCLVVPFSTVAPEPVEAFHYVIPVGAYPFFHPHKDVWAKSDMLTCVAFRRLDRVLLNGRYVAPSLRPDDFAAIQLAILAALEISHRP